MNGTEFHAKTITDTQNFASQMAENAKKGDIFTLKGPLGAGKTLFARAFIQHLCPDAAHVPSPTFTLAQYYEGPIASLVHLDLYRLQNAEDIYEIGWEDFLAHQSILLIEWAERLGNLLPDQHTEIALSIRNENERLIRVTKHGG